jgi:two-component system nitrate/nitrite response regulator NarL
VRLVVGGDHRLFVDALAAAMSRAGATVAARAWAPQEVLAEVSRHKPDICLLAAHSPNSGSLVALREIGVHFPGVRALVLSENPDPAIVTAAVDGGAAGFIRKGQNIMGLIEILRRIMVGERVMDADPARPQSCTFNRSAAAAPERISRLLTAREHQVLLLMMDGTDTKQIARSLAISVSTVRTHVRSVLVKLGAHSRLEASSMAARYGLLDASGRNQLRPAAQAAPVSG